MNRLNLMQAALAVLIFSLAPLAATAQETGPTNEQFSQLDINQADVASIAAALDGVGMVKAREIVAYREMFGSFRSVEELLEVKGIGAATLERNRDRILIVIN